MTQRAPVLFVDSNVLIEAVLIPLSAAAVVSDLVVNGIFDMATCALTVEDAERAFLKKVLNPAELDILVHRWEEMKSRMRLEILADPSLAEVKQAYEKYIGVMRHKADIPVLAAALSMNPAPHVILSGNREHFNDAVAQRCGIKICSCQEFIGFISRAP